MKVDTASVAICLVCKPRLTRHLQIGICAVAMLLLEKLKKPLGDMCEEKGVVVVVHKGQTSMCWS